MAARGGGRSDGGKTGRQEPQYRGSGGREHCPTDCDCRKNNTSGSSSGSSFGGSSGGTSSVSGGSKNAGSSAQTPASSEAPAPTTEPITKEEGTGFTQNGNSVTRDLLYVKYSNKQFITIETRNGETFYLVIDYDKPLDEDGERYETYWETVFIKCVRRT